MTDPTCSLSWKIVVELIRQLRGQQARSNKGMISTNAPQEPQPELAGTRSGGLGTDLADAEAGGAASESQRVLAGQAAACRRWAALHQAGRRDPLRGSLPSAVDEGPAAHLDQRLMQSKLMANAKRAWVTTLALVSFLGVIIVHLITSVYISVTQLKVRINYRSTEATF